jgi:hypothetical protein
VTADFGDEAMNLDGPQSGDGLSGRRRHGS